MCAAMATAAESADAYRSQCSRELEEAEKIFRDLEKMDGVRTIETVLKPLNEMERILDKSAGRASLFYNVHPDESVRDAALPGTLSW